MHGRPAFICLTLVVCTACGSSATAPTPTTPTSTASTSLFQGTLDPGGTATQTYTATVAAAVKLTLANVSVDPAQPLAQALTLGAGTPNPDGSCAVATTASAMPALSPQLTGSAPAGAYCVTVSDPGSHLGTSVNFSVLVVNGSTVSQVTSPGTATWASGFGLGTNASASRLIPTSASGTLSVSLDSLSYQAGQVGLALGIPGPGGIGCVPASVIVGGISTKISAPVDGGNFCAEVYNVGHTTGLVNFSTTISYP